MEEHYFWYLASIPLLGIAAQWLAWRLGLPSILLLLGFGVLLGQVLNPNELLNELAGVAASTENGSLASRLLFPFVSLSVCVILFEGGLSLRIHELTTAGRGVVGLVTIGVAVSWLLTSLAAMAIFGFDRGVAALLGAVLVVTGPTVVAPLLRHIRPVRKVASLVKWEGIVVDPIGAVLAVVVFESVLHVGSDSTWLGMFLPLLRTAVVGIGMGIGTGLLLVQFVKRYWVPDFLQAVFFLAVALTVFAISNTMQEESGLVTVTVLGVFLANQKTIGIQHVIEFKEHLRVFLISGLFIVLGSTLEPKSVYALGWGGVGFVLLLIVVIRPISVYAATLVTKLSWAERTFLAFLAPRGIVAAAVTSVFALKIATIADGKSNPDQWMDWADQLMPITFLVIVGTVAVYGILAAPLARWLKLSDTNPQGILFAGADVAVREIASSLQGEGIQVLLVDTNYANVAAAKMQGLPAECVSILQEHVREELDLAGLGRLLAMTANDEVNSMAIREYTYVFGSANMYQLTPRDDKSGQRSSIAAHLRGRLLFDEQLVFDQLMNRLERGDQVKNTRLTAEYGLEDFRKRYGESAMLLFVVDGSGGLSIGSADSPLNPELGDLVIALVRNPEECQ